MPPSLRRQLTLFIAPHEAGAIESVRQKFNPRQFEIIKAHVTLCRENEIQNLEKVIANLLMIIRTQPPIVIELGKVTRFDHGKGLWLPAANGNKEFECLRNRVLSGLTDNPGKQDAHITLIHPRNATCTDDIFEQIEKVDLPTRLMFNRISLIEQENSGPWNTIQEFDLVHRKEHHKYE